MELTNFVLKSCCYTVDYIKHVPKKNTNIKHITHITQTFIGECNIETTVWTSATKGTHKENPKY